MPIPFPNVTLSKTSFTVIAFGRPLKQSVVHVIQSYIHVTLQTKKNWITFGITYRYLCMHTVIQIHTGIQALIIRVCDYQVLPCKYCLSMFLDSPCYSHDFYLDSFVSNCTEQIYILTLCSMCIFYKHKLYISILKNGDP